MDIINFKNSFFSGFTSMYFFLKKIIQFKKINHNINYDNYDDFNQIANDFNKIIY